MGLIAQQTDSVDLTHLLPSPETAGQSAMPEGCKKWTGGGIGDGWAETEDKQPRHIVVRIVSTNQMEPALGSEVEATVQMSNADSHPITIPWSTDPDVIRQGQPQDSLQWEAGTFEFRLEGQLSGHILLRSLTSWLQSSKYVPGSEITIQPGQSVTALVRFRVEDLYPVAGPRLLEGKWRLSARWEQVGRSWSKKDCAVWNFYNHYDKYYQQQNIPFTIEVTAPKLPKPPDPR